MNVRLLGLFMACGLSIPVAQAQMLQPGLWELSSSNIQVDGQQLPELQVMLGQLQNMLTPEQKSPTGKPGADHGGQRCAGVPDARASEVRQHSAD